MVESKVELEKRRDSGRDSIWPYFCVGVTRAGGKDRIARMAKFPIWANFLGNIERACLKYLKRKRGNYGCKEIIFPKLGLKGLEKYF